jgi:hypothetical protein
MKTDDQCPRCSLKAKASARAVAYLRGARDAAHS